MKHRPKMISLPERTLERGLERARKFRLPFSHYLAYLIEEDFRSGRVEMKIAIEDDMPHIKENTS